MMIIRDVLLGAAMIGYLVTFPTASFAGYKPTAAERSDCMGDALSLCSFAIPNTDRIVTCLGSKKSQLSASCRAHFDNH